tara:strand:+ start:3246 stop:3647 length:402 start_codon:yes stop_codon:yes gene_type:complete
MTDLRGISIAKKPHEYWVDSDWDKNIFLFTQWVNLVPFAVLVAVFHGEEPNNQKNVVEIIADGDKVNNITDNCYPIIEHFCLSESVTGKRRVISSLAGKGMNKMAEIYEEVSNEKKDYKILIKLLHEKKFFDK